MAKNKKSSSTSDLQRVVTAVQRHRSKFSGLGHDLWLRVCDTARQRPLGAGTRHSSQHVELAVVTGSGLKWSLCLTRSMERVFGAG
ncbi:hypothetical protein F2Q70_00036666 [Brassica cretica]|uniref:Uncharacterized protein n=1 Tax=Brassica cretica TaxID=69181 RepID=A0A8S9JYB6_BRACR|nr:hypothetical protein F2Q70_00036666 [Brassica cretica]